MLKKILLTLGVVLLFLVAAAIILPIVYKDKIVLFVKNEVNKNINAKVDFGDFDLSLIRHFPDFTLSINKLSVIGINEFAGDTLTSAQELNLTVDLMSVIKGKQIDIESIQLVQPFINLLVLKDGKANWDIAKTDSAATPSGEPSKFKVALKKYSIENGRIIYNDESMDFKLTLDQLTHQGKGDFTQDLFVLSTQTNAEKANMWYGGVKYLHNVITSIKADLNMDMPNMKFTFKDNEINLNELALGLDGWVAMPKEDIAMDLKFEAKKNEFRNFLSMVPGVYKEGFKDLKSGGTLSLKGFIKGVYTETHMPGFGVDVKIQNGNFKYPSLPVAVNNVQVDLAINNADGVPDHTAIDLTKMHAELGGESIDAKLRVRTPVSDADLNGMLKANINFANLSKIVPLEQGTSIRGQMKADLSLNGRMSAIEQKRYQDFKADGSLSLSDFNYSSKDYKQGFELKQCSLTFNPQNVTLNSFVAKMGSSDFNLNGSLDNLLAYFFKKETLKGSMNLRSNQISLADFESTATTTTTTSDTAKMALVTVPANVDFTLNTSIGKLIYDNVKLEQVNGKVIIHDQAVNMENLSFKTLGGSMKMSGIYSTRVRKQADMQFKMDISGFDIQQTVKTFNTVKKLAPIAERATGSFGTTMVLNGKLDEYMQPVLNTLSGNGKLTTNNVVISQFPPLVKVAEALKLDQFKQLAISNTNISYKFRDGRVSVDPFDVNMGGFPVNVKGSTGFDQSIDYVLGMNIPTSKIPSQATSVLSGLISQANSKGANLSMGQNIKVNALIGGTVSNPTVKTDLKDIAGNAVKDIKESVKAEIDTKKQELEQKAKEEAEKYKKQAEDKAKAEKEKLKKEAEKKAKDALNNIFK